MNEENRPLFSKDLRERMAAQLKAIRVEGFPADCSTVSVSLHLILEALLEM